MTEKQEKWWKSQRIKYPDKTDEEIREIYRQAGKKGKGIKRKSGFYKNSELAREMGSRGGKSRWKNR